MPLPVFRSALMVLLSIACSRATASGLLYVPSVNVSSFAASVNTDDQVVVRWQTDLELGVWGFRLMRSTDGVSWTPATATPIAAHGNESGDSYAVVDAGAPRSVRLSYNLLLDATGSTNRLVASWEGFPARMNQAQSSARTVQTIAPQLATSSRAVPNTQWIGTLNRVQAWTNAIPADRVRLSVINSGVYRVTVQELASAWGMDTGAVSTAVAATNLVMSCQGTPVAWYAENTNLYFYGQATTNQYAPENVYWLSLGVGQGMNTTHPPLSSSPAVNASFMNSVMQQGTSYLGRVSYSSLTAVPYLTFSTLAGGQSLQASVALPGCAAGSWTGLVTVSLLSFWDVGAANSTAKVSVGGTSVGSPAWPGEQCLSWTYPFSSSLLNGSTASLTIQNTGTGSSIPASLACVSYGLTYACNYQATNGWLLCTGGTGDTVAVTGFATNDVLVLDVSNPIQPAVILSATNFWDAASGSWMAEFSSGDTGNVYAVSSRSSGYFQSAVRGVRDVDWSSASNAMSYAILVPPEAWRSDIAPVMEPLAAYRNRQGLATEVVDVESLYNHYTYGLADPAAIQAFARDGWSWSSPRLRYMLLAGGGSLDYQQLALSVNSYTACLIPTLAAGQQFINGDGMSAALDAEFGDVSTNGVPDIEIAIGRLPTTSAQSMALLVQKTIAYESGWWWKHHCSLVGDWTNVGTLYYNFTGGTDRVVAPLTFAGRVVNKDYPSSNDQVGNLTGVALTSLFPQLQVGAGLFHFFGHSNEQSLSGGNYRLLNNNGSYGASTTISSNLWQKPTVAVFIGCRVNRWQSLTSTVCIEPYGVFATNTGFVAAIGATGDVLADEGEALGVTLCSVVASNQTFRLGDVLRQAQHDTIINPPLNPNRLAYPDNTGATNRLLCVNLTGDPALLFSLPANALYLW